MAGVKRLLLVLMKWVKSDLIDEYGFTNNVVGKPIPVTPKAWDLTQGLSHYAYVIDGLKLKDLERIEKFQRSYNGITFHEFRKIIGPNKKPTGELETVEQVLDRLGAVVNTLALEDEDEIQKASD